MQIFDVVQQILISIQASLDSIIQLIYFSLKIEDICEVDQFCR